MKTMEVNFAKASEIENLQTFYHLSEYGGTVSANDQVVFVTQDKKIIGAGRLSKEEDIYILRGMRVLAEHRGHGVGKMILESLVRNPAFLSSGLKSGINFIKALDIPNRQAPACPVSPPPKTLIFISY